MCYAVVRVKYKAQGEQPQLIPFQDQEALDKRIGELQATDTVAAIQVFNLARTYQRTEEWKLS